MYLCSQPCVLYTTTKKNSPYRAASLYNKWYLGTSGLIVWIKLACAIVRTVTK